MAFLNPRLKPYDPFTLAAAGKLKPHVSAIFPLERFGEAMRLLSDRKAIGRVVLTMER